MSEARKLTMAVHQGRFVKRSGRQDWPEAERQVRINEELKPTISAGRRSTRSIQLENMRDIQSGPRIWSIK